MKHTPIKSGSTNTTLPRKRNRLSKIIEEFDRSNFDVYKVYLEPGEYTNLRSAQTSCWHAIDRLHRTNSIKVKTFGDELCVYLIKRGAR